MRVTNSLPLIGPGHIDSGIGMEEEASWRSAELPSTSSIAGLQANPVGGTRQAEAGWGRIRGTVDIGFGKLSEWNGLTFHATALAKFASLDSINSSGKRVL